MFDITLICAADLHLGRQVGAFLKKSFCIQAWEKLIETCLQKNLKVDALLLAGDVIDGDDLFIEMYGILKKGIKRLLENDIKVVAIAGNHDPQVLNQIQKSLDMPGFYLLGTSGDWERLTLNIKGKNLHIDGLSFTSAIMESNPFDQYKLTPAPKGEPLVGLLHCDVGISSSKYGPVLATDFYKMEHDAWILGHIHIPKEISCKPQVRYCGSLQGLDISESGSHGALQLTITQNKTITMKTLPLAPLRWESLSIDLSNFSLDDWENRLFQEIENQLTQQIKDENEHLEVVGLRLSLEGRTQIFRELRSSEKKIEGQDSSGFYLNGKWIPYFIESIQNETKPLYDLERLAEGSDFAGTLAKKLLNFKKSPVATNSAIYRHLESKYQKDSALKQCPESWLTAEEAEELFLIKGYELLDELLEQRH